MFTLHFFVPQFISYFIRIDDKEDKEKREERREKKEEKKMTSNSQQQKVKSVNETQSLALMRNMFRISISAICYSRNLFPDDCFVKKPYSWS